MEVVAAGRPGCRGDHPAAVGLMSPLLAGLAWPMRGSLFCLRVPGDASGTARVVRFVFCYVFSPSSLCASRTPPLECAHIFCLLSVLFFCELCFGAALVPLPSRLPVAVVAGSSVFVALRVPPVAACRRSMSSTAYSTRAVSPLSS